MSYSKGKIYRLVCNTTGQQYIGSTSQSLSQRLGNHKSEYKRFLYGKITDKLTSFSILSENNFEMILIEDYPCENKNQLERRERHFIETMECINKVKPAQTREEHLEYNRQYDRQYRKDHKEEISKINRDYRQKHKEERSALTNCECGGKYKHQSRSTHFKTNKHTSYFE